MTGLEKTIAPWGETISVLRRESASAFLIPAYIAALLAPVIGLVGGFGLMKRDRVGGLLTVLTSIAYCSAFSSASRSTRAGCRFRIWGRS